MWTLGCCFEAAGLFSENETALGWVSERGARAQSSTGLAQVRGGDCRVDFSVVLLC